MSTPEEPTPELMPAEPAAPRSMPAEPAGYLSPQGYAVPPGMYLDQNAGLVLPNGTTLASVGRRIGAYFLAIPLAIVTLGIGYLIWGLIVWPKGTSPALQVLGMRCWVKDEGKPAGFGRMALRDIVGGIATGILAIITGLISFVLFLAQRDHRSLADLIGGTVVLHDPDKVLG